MKQYPEHEKLDGVKAESQFLGSFIEWLNEKEMCIAYYPEGSETLRPVRKSISTLLGEHLNIDLVKLENEKVEMLNQLRELQTNRTT